MENIRKKCATIADTISQQEIRKLAKILSENFNARSVRSIALCEDLLYWLYIYDSKKLCFDLCNAICRIEFSADLPIFDYLVSIHALHVRLLNEKQLTDEAEFCRKGVVASYVNRPKVLRRFLEGSFLYYKEIEAAQIDTDVKLEMNWKFSQYKRLCFISELGGSQSFPKERAEKEMIELQGSLIKLSQIDEKIKREKSYSTFMQKGASDAEIDKLYKTFAQVKIPAEFIDFYKIHNGQTPYTQGIIDDFYELLSIDSILEEWNAWKELVLDDEFDYTSFPDPGIKNDWYNLLWIPIASNGCGDNYCLDLDPTSEGTYGQIISVVHDDAIRSVEALSFTSFLENYLGENYLERM